MKHVDLTSGIGGFALAARWVGWETVGFCEIDPWCRRVLAQHWPEVEQHDDLKTLTAEHVRKWLGRGGLAAANSDRSAQRQPGDDDQTERRQRQSRMVYSSGSARYGVDDRAQDVGWILTAGYPCQPFSHAGMRAGEDDPRHLWPAIYRILEGLQGDRPDWVVFENVRGHVSMGLDGVLDDLESIGYATRTFVVPAAGVGALHRRDRVWIVGCRANVVHADGGSDSWRHKGRDADRGNGAAPPTHGHGQPGRTGGSSPVAHASGRENDGRGRGSMAGEEGPGRCGDAAVEPSRSDVGDADLSRLEGDRKPGRCDNQAQRQAWDAWRASHSGAAEHGTEVEPGFRGAVDGLSAWLDGPLGAFGRGWEYGVPLTVSESMPDRVNRLKALGNAIVPQVAYVIFACIDDAEREFNVRRSDAL